MIRNLVFALALAAGAAGSAEAARRLSVSFDDLDFAKPADVETFNKRLDAAARDGCAGQPAVQLVGAQRVACRKLIRERLIAQLPEARRQALAATPVTAVETAAR